MAVSRVGTKVMEWGEAYRLTTVLLNDPSSQVFAAMAEWPFPVSREWIVTADLRDSSEYARIGRRARTYPRPWTEKRHVRRGTASYTPDQLRAVLAHHRARKGPADG